MNVPGAIPPPPRGESASHGAFAAASLALFALHLVLARASNGPILYEDGIGYLATAKFIAGVEPTPEVGPMAFYHSGYAFLLAPIFLLFESPDSIHRTALVLNSIIATLHPPILSRLGRDAFGLPPRVALGFALLAALYPPYLLQSNFVWTESVLPVLFSLHLWIGFRLVSRPSVSGAAWFGSVTAILFLVHPRMLPVLGTSAGLLLAFAWRDGARAVQAFVGLATMAALFLATREWHAFVFETLWIPGSFDHAADWTDRLPDVAQWGALLVRATSHAWAATIATFGLAPLGIAALIGRARRESDSGRRIFAILVLAEVSIVFAVSAVFLLVPGRSDHLVYGRYNDVVLGPVLVAALAALRSMPPRRILVLGSIATPAFALLGAAVTAWATPPEVLRSYPMLLTILGILPFTWGERVLVFPLRMSALAIGALVALAVTTAASKRAGAALLATTFVVGAFFVEARILRPFVDHWAGIVTIHRLVGDPAPAEIAYDDNALLLYGINGYPFWLPRTRFVRFDGRRERPPARLVISARDWVGEKKWGATLLGVERHFDQALWSVPAEAVRSKPPRAPGETSRATAGLR